MRTRTALSGLIMVAVGLSVACPQTNGTSVQPPNSTNYSYSRVGAKDDVQTHTTPGVALDGGGLLNEPFVWLCNKSGGGDFLIINATDDEGDKLAKMVFLACNVNSAAVLTIPSRKAANDPFVADVIKKAEAIFIGGGEQKDYINFWQGTPVQEAINEQVSRGVPIGGSSAGMAILGEFAYTGAGVSAQSSQTLLDPFNERIVIAHGFLHIAQLNHLITDQHLVARNRLGRLLGFVARIETDEHTTDIRAIGVDQDSAVLIEPDGSAEIVGRGSGAYFIRPSASPTVCEPGKPLTFRHIELQHENTGGYFNLATWNGQGDPKYEVNVEAGTLHSIRSEGY